ncbi:uncharacterized protein LOC119278136 [Triticum dicoccoides]|uniref:uncharacterized protein LOC119278136 n=1 Tax=Triticum dicoccoides TaxID=85692 RepID=UPI00188EEACD|nr:uncharacterized protein LOC119278136 [Triticum dicoccoides]
MAASACARQKEEAVVMATCGTHLSRRRCKRAGKRRRPEGGSAPATVVVEWNGVWGVVPGKQARGRVFLNDSPQLAPTNFSDVLIRVEEHIGEVSRSDLGHTSADLLQFDALSLNTTPPTLQSSDRFCWMHLTIKNQYWQQSTRGCRVIAHDMWQYLSFIYCCLQNHLLLQISSARSCAYGFIRRFPTSCVLRLDSALFLYPKAKHARFRLGYLKPPLWSETHVYVQSDTELIDDSNYIWTYTSMEFRMLQENVMQSFKLPHSVLCIGGVVKIELLGRVHKDTFDGLYYIFSKTISHDLEVDKFCQGTYSPSIRRGPGCGGD